MMADRIGMFVAVVCGALVLPIMAGEALADRAQTTTARPSAARTGGNAALPARATPMRATATRNTASARPTAAAKATGARGTNLRRVAITSAAQRGGGYGGGLSCVPYARMVTGMDVSGNAAMWWHNAAGSYLRGARPEPGAVLVFRATGGMRLGHVSVVERVVSSREILIHHSNWGGPGIRRGTVMRGVSVVDASDNNDWSAVRVQVGHQAVNYGRTYPTYGFIHNRPDNGRMMRADASAAGRFEEVADAGAGRSPHAVAHEAASIESLTPSSRR
ncbi:CHAP domain-containing protein [Humitalea sp. 24SJ18S-53]|uniref:CHAP domain-containing protein n=1 Tax=Humitalea sp. 24SJ18S-53 TaxID=3422307 RepID=UPI003D66F1EA